MENIIGSYYNFLIYVLIKIGDEVKEFERRMDMEFEKCKLE